VAIVTEDDAAAAMNGEAPLSADEKTFLEIQGYRRALSYVLAQSENDKVSWTVPKGSCLRP
jgi:hypothetical protein